MATVVFNANEWVAQWEGSRILWASSKAEVVESCQALLAFERTECRLKTPREHTNVVPVWLKISHQFECPMCMSRKSLVA